jgi:hypothetical protein
MQIPVADPMAGYPQPYATWATERRNDASARQATPAGQSADATARGATTSPYTVDTTA